MRLSVIALMWVAACDDHVFVRPGTHLKSAGGPPGGEPSPTAPSSTTGEGFCGVLQVFGAHCLSCHAAASAIGGLDLETDPHAALVDQLSAAYGVVLVAPGDPQGSLLYRKVSGAQSADEGGLMPPTGALFADQVDLIDAWIADGASEECEGGGVVVPPVRYHPDGWADQEHHGLAAKLQTEACTSCHGGDLTGGTVGVSCDSCHQEGWRTNCTFCHGGVEDSTGGPPRGIDGTMDAEQLGFWAHPAHVVDTQVHAAFGCFQCHQEPTDVLSPGHLFVGDPTPGEAETDFTGGLSTLAVWDGAGTCSNLYCHGDRGLDNGTMAQAEGPRACGDCHPDPSSGRDAWKDRMSGEHEKHLREGVACASCHGGTVDEALQIVDPGLHVNGQADVRLPDGMTYGEQSCNGACHAPGADGEVHEDRRWR